MYLVSICIPTYNRCEYLKKSLESLITQRPFIDGKVEVVVSDNASNDGTEELMNYYINKYDNIVYYRNETNVRDRNFPLVISRASGKLRKLSNDTLEYLPDSLEFLCNCAIVYNKDKTYLYFSNRQTNNEVNVYDFKNFVLNTSFNIIWIGSFSMWDCECKEDDYDGCETSLWQVKKAYEIVHNNNKGIVIDKLLFLVQDVINKNISYGIYKVFYLNYFYIFQQYLDSKALDLSCKECIEKDLLFKFFYRYILLWDLNKGTYVYSNEENLKKLVFNQYSKKSYFWKFKLKYIINKYRLIIKAYLKRG